MINVCYSRELYIWEDVEGHDPIHISEKVYWVPWKAYVLLKRPSQCHQKGQVLSGTR